ncbi:MULTISPECIES: D-alanyl-D-alanine carboxypeptidase family protein [Actibacterium]|uniref:serine-type D-Ala-D-Ala carboxypeptidase n=1 Tax=Actibacterium naphthalenivorans TaxID=1614693 RepID=A0A840CG73_9RHOB|nr:MULTISPECIES: D-alanyl-D-alanine carboxypeptidase family protein [Actibacterium]ALG90702.1 D-Ala-D-Ala carboxypeptidase [Actibacterium sp. EMB200-NS6]MBB4023102.1 D-alanyl-D-alanine carboxypeptidase (penicillin-binding protein 5/6) [Actibacterium naphthalenivorans]
MRRIYITLLALLAALPLASAARASFETRATAAYVLDQTTGTVLLSKNAETPLPPASMSKLMTLNMLFEALRDGRVTMDTQFSVSTNAMNMGGSTMFLNDRDRPTVRDLIRGIIVQSGNDACVVVAEGLAGTEDGFARLMNERARALGMENSTFANASGWPNPGHRMSMKDLAILANRLITEFPEYYGFFGEAEYEFDGRAPQNRFNRNPLLKMGIGADGMKTGHTQEAGYGLVGSAQQGPRRVIVVISGLNSEAERAQEAERLINWAFRQFVQKTVVEKGTRLAEARVWLGAAPRVGLVAADDIELVVPAVLQGGINAEIAFETPIEAPIAAGQEIGELVINLPDMEEVRVPLVAATAVARGGFLPRLRTAAQVLFRKMTAEAQGL